MLRLIAVFASALSVFISAKDCYNPDGNCAYNGIATCRSLAGYTGNVSVTQSGWICQAWNVDTPHIKSDAEVAAYGNEAHNHCRNIDNGVGPWCYTTNPGVRWEYCFPSCPPESPKNPADSKFQECESIGKVSICVHYF